MSDQMLAVSRLLLALSRTVNQQLVHSLFYLALCRMLDLELALSRQFSELCLTLHFLWHRDPRLWSWLAIPQLLKLQVLEMAMETAAEEGHPAMGVGLVAMAMEEALEEVRPAATLASLRACLGPAGSVSFVEATMSSKTARCSRSSLAGPVAPYTRSLSALSSRQQRQPPQPPQRRLRLQLLCQLSLCGPHLLRMHRLSPPASRRCSATLPTEMDHHVLCAAFATCARTALFTMALVVAAVVAAAADQVHLGVVVVVAVVAFETTQAPHPMCR